LTPPGPPQYETTREAADAALPAVPIGPDHHHLWPVPDCDLYQLQRPLDPRRPSAAGDQPGPRTLPHGRGPPLTRQPTPTSNLRQRPFCEEPRNGTDYMTPARSRTATAAPPTGRTASSGLWLRLSPTLGRRRNPGWQVVATLAGPGYRASGAHRGPGVQAWADHQGGDQPGRLGPCPRRVALDGRRVRVGWFRTMDPHMIGVTIASRTAWRC
jgi:hypothetical protein